MTTLLEKARDLLASHDAILLAILFGSMTTGHAQPWSDVDIGVYVTTPLSLLETGKLTADLERLIEQDVDFLVLNDALEHNPALAYRVIAEGKLLFCKDDSAFVSFKTSVILRYLDTAFLREMVTRAFYERLETGRFGKETWRDAVPVAATQSECARASALPTDIFVGEHQPCPASGMGFAVWSSPGYSDRHRYQLSCRQSEKSGSARYIHRMY